MSSVPQTSAASAPNVVLGGAALAVGALIAGVAIGRRSRWGLLVGLGVAAVAGYQLLKQRRGLDAEQDLGLDRVAEPAAAPAPVAESPCPATPSVPEGEPLSLPLISKATQAPPAGPVPAAAAFAPLIWEGGDSGSRSSDDLGETVWFGLQDVSLVATATPEVTSIAPAPASMGEVALEGDLAPVVATFLADFPPAPQLEMPAPPPLSADVAALILALNPPPLSSAQFTAEASAVGASVFAGVAPGLPPSNLFDDENDPAEGHHESFLLEDAQDGDAPAPTGKGAPLAAAALVSLSLLGLGLGFGQMKSGGALPSPVAVHSLPTR